MKRIIFPVAMMVFFAIALVWGCDTGLQVETWEHGTVLCSAKSIVIELGHENDPEVQELFSLAKDCQKE